MADSATYETDIFINCPFDPQYRPIFEAIVFCVAYCGIRPRCALEVEDSAQVRIDKIFELIGACRFGIHDISRTEIDRDTLLPRFNMPLELGIFLGAKRFGTGRQRRKNCLILDSDRYRYQKFISDIAGQDIRAHRASPYDAIRIVRDWLRTNAQDVTLPGGGRIIQRYEAFLIELPALCKEFSLEHDQMVFADFSSVLTRWLRTNR